MFAKAIDVHDSNTNVSLICHGISDSHSRFIKTLSLKN